MPEAPKVVEHVTAGITPEEYFAYGVFPEVHLSMLSVEKLATPRSEDFLLCVKGTGVGVRRYLTKSGEMHFLWVEAAYKELVTCQECLELLHA